MHGNARRTCTCTSVRKQDNILITSFLHRWKKIISHDSIYWTTYLHYVYKFLFWLNCALQKTNLSFISLNTPPFLFLLCHDNSQLLTEKLLDNQKMFRKYLIFCISWYWNVNYFSQIFTWLEQTYVVKLRYPLWRFKSNVWYL